jgi:hypothetical protein
MCGEVHRSAEQPQVRAYVTVVCKLLPSSCQPRGTLTEGDAPDPVTVVALQQRGIIRRRARAGYLELTDDARFSLAPEPPDPDRSALTLVAPPLSS